VKRLARSETFLRKVFRTRHEREPTPKELEELAQVAQRVNERLVVNVEPEQAIQAMLGAAPRLARLFCNRSWMVIQIEGARLLTSDACVTSWEDMSRPGAHLYGGSWATADDVYLPISPNQCLHLTARTHGARANTVQVLSEAATAPYVERINFTIATRARRWIVQHPGSNALAGMTLPAVRPPLRFD